MSCPVCGRSHYERRDCDPKVLRGIDAANTAELRRDDFDVREAEPTVNRRLSDGFFMLSLGEE